MHRDVRCCGNMVTQGNTETEDMVRALKPPRKSLCSATPLYFNLSSSRSQWKLLYPYVPRAIRVKSNYSGE